MPLYDYACPHCGRFSASRPLREFDRPVPCPACGAAAPRSLGVPALLGRTARREAAAADADYARWKYATGCGCCPPWRG